MEFHIVIVDLPHTTTPQSKYGYATSQATKKEQNLNMSAPPPRPRRRRALASAAERDDIWTQRPGIILFGLPTTGYTTKYRGARPLVVTSAQSIKEKAHDISVCPRRDGYMIEHVVSEATML